MICPLFKKDFCLRAGCRYFDDKGVGHCNHVAMQKRLEDERAKKKQERDAEYERYKTMSHEEKRELVRERFPELGNSSGEGPALVAAKEITGGE